MEYEYEVIRIAILGGGESGKSSLLRRLHEVSESNYLFRHHYNYLREEMMNAVNPYNRQIDFHNANILHFNALMTTNFCLNIQVCEVNLDDTANPNSNKFNWFEEVDGSLLLIDCGNIESLKDADHILSRIKDKNDSIPTFLLANKADNNTHVVNPNTLDVFVRSSKSLPVINWAYTVSIGELGDFDCKRGKGRWNYQKSIDDVFFSVLRSILEKKSIPGNLMCKSFIFNDII